MSRGVRNSGKDSLVEEKVTTQEEQGDDDEEEGSTCFYPTETSSFGEAIRSQ